MSSNSRILICIRFREIMHFQPLSMVREHFKWHFLIEISSSGKKREYRCDGKGSRFVLLCLLTWACRWVPGSRAAELGCPAQPGGVGNRLGMPSCWQGSALREGAGLCIKRSVLKQKGTAPSGAHFGGASLIKILPISLRLAYACRVIAWI